MSMDWKQPLTVLRTVASSLLIVSSLLAGVTTQSNSAFPSRIAEPYVNLYGAPVTDAQGRPIVYDKAELERQRLAWLESYVPEPEPSVGECEASVARADWMYYTMGSNIGKAGMFVSSVSGQPELVVSCGGEGFFPTRYWMILQKANGPGGRYFQRWVSPAYDSPLVWIETANLDQDPSPEVAIILDDGTFQIWDQAERQLQDEFAIASDVFRIRLVDIDGDGSLEILAVTLDELLVYTDSGELKWSVDAGGRDFVVGQMDDDPSLEIAMTDGTVLDVAMRAQQWIIGGLNILELECGDVDGDGMEELIGRTQWLGVRAWDVDEREHKWTIGTGQTDADATALSDLDGDGVLELVIALDQGRDLVGYSTANRQEEWRIENPDHGTTEVILADADGDGEVEVIWGAGNTSSGPDHMYVARWQDQQQEWQNIMLAGPYHGPVRGDVDGDGRFEMVVLSSDSPSGARSRILVFNHEHRLQGISQAVPGTSSDGGQALSLANIDGDSELEIVVATNRANQATIEIYNYVGGFNFWRTWWVSDAPSGLDFRAAQVVDLDGDSRMEVVGCTGGVHPHQVGHVVSFDLESGLTNWESVSIDVSGRGGIFEVANVDDDPILEICVVGSEGDVWVLDGSTGAIESEIVGDYTTIESSPMFVQPDLIRLGDSNGRLVTLQFQNLAYTEIEVRQLLDQPIDGLTLRGSSYWISSGDVLSLFGAEDEPLWTSCSAYGPLGLDVAFGRDFALTTGHYGLVAFTRPSCP